jgi:feruloyl esterase
MKTAFVPDAKTTVLLVKAFKKGDPLALSGTPASPTPPTAQNDLCLVKLNVGPGNPGPAGAPSTSPGIGIEVWLPAPANWNQRIHNLGNGGWAGGLQGDITQIDAGAGAPPLPAQIAGTEGSVVSSSDDGHAGTPPIVDASFAMNPDGTINTTLWQDFSDRALHEQAVKTKALVQAYYLQPQKYAYYEGCSTGGRQGYTEIEKNPTDYDGYVVGAPAFNWSKFITAELYPQIVIQRDLGGVGPTAAQDALVGGAAVSACDMVNGQHLGYVRDPSTCTYDPTRDASVLCAGTTSNGVTGTNATAACVSPAMAKAYNKFWYGETPDGSAPDPTADNGFNANPTGNQLWYGLTRGTKTSGLTGSAAFPIATGQVALELQNPSIGDPLFRNATGNGINGWMNLSYAGLANAFNQGVALQPFFGNINTDNPDLSGVKQTKAKIIHYHGLNDTLIFPQGSINYYTRVANLDGGFASTQQYDRLFLVPGLSHCFGVGTQSGTAGPAATANSVPLPAGTFDGQWFSVMTDWVENGNAPASITVQSADASTSQLLCPYPQKATYKGTGRSRRQRTTPASSQPWLSAAPRKRPSPLQRCALAPGSPRGSERPGGHVSLDVCDRLLAGFLLEVRNYRFGSTAGLPASYRLAMNLPFAAAPDHSILCEGHGRSRESDAFLHDCHDVENAMDLRTIPNEVWRLREDRECPESEI